MRRVSIVAFVLFAGCSKTSPPAQIQPQAATATTPLPPIEVVRRATTQLVALGLEVGVIDATGGVVVASIDRMKPESDGSFAYVRCSHSDMATYITLSITVNAIKRDEGSSVTIRNRLKVPANWQGEDVDKCASTGLVERRILAAIATP